MALVQLYEKQDLDFKDFETLRDNTWADMKRRQEYLISAFGSKESLPEQYRKLIDQEINEFVKEWSLPEGQRYKGLLAEKQKQIKDLSPKPSVTNQTANRSKANHFSQNLASIRAKKISLNKTKSPEKFRGFDENRDSMDI